MGKDRGPKDRGFKNAPKLSQMRARIAAAAARMMAEDGIEDLATAKRKAARLLGATDTQSMPGNDEVEAELRTYFALFKRDEHSERLQALREMALELLHEFAAFNPYLSGSVLKGTAGRFADIDIQLFADNSKEVEIFLINRGIAYETDAQRLYCGDELRVVPIAKLEWQGVSVNVAICDLRDERTVLKTSLGGRAIERASADAVAALLAQAEARAAAETPANAQASIHAVDADLP